MLKFTGPSSALTFTSTVHVPADTFNCRANVNAHTHIMPAYVLSFQNTQFLAMDSAHFISFFISSTITPSLIQRVQTESSKFVKHRKADQEYCVKMLLDLFGLDPTLLAVTYLITK